MPMTCRRSCRMENPVRSTAESPARQGSAASRAITAVHPAIWIAFVMGRILTVDHFCHGCGHSALVVAERYAPATAAQLLAGIPHDNRMPGKLKHFHIVVVVTDGHDLFAPEAAVRGPPLQRVALGAA